jgi:hypothetical protein
MPRKRRKRTPAKKQRGGVYLPLRSRRQRLNLKNILVGGGRRTRSRGKRKGQVQEGGIFPLLALIPAAIAAAKAAAAAAALGAVGAGAGYGTKKLIKHLDK